MSFGTSVSDIITTLDKAFKLVKKLKSAPEDIAQLALEVTTLQQSLEAAKGLVAGNDLPGHYARRTSLLLAIKSCRVVIEQTDAFVDKYLVLATKERSRYLKLLKFVASDVNSRKAQLQSNCQLLSLSLASLNALSIENLARSLQVVVRENQDEKHAPSVLSSVLNKSKRAEADELFESVTMQLEEKGVHPDAIEYNEPTIRLWLAEIEEHPWNDAVLKKRAEPNEAFEGAFNSNFSDVTLAGQEDAESTDDAMETISGLSEGPEEDAARPPIDEDDDDTTSMRSHRSKPDEWRPYDRSEERYVLAMLNPYFACDPWKVPSAEFCDHRIKRAFHQLDWLSRGEVERLEVQVLAAKLLGIAGVKDDSVSKEEIETLVYQFDTDKDAQLDLREFTSFTLKLIQRCATVRRGMVTDRLLELGSQVASMTDLQREISDQRILPWGFSNTQRGERGLYDEVLEKALKSVPTLRLAHDTFTAMAWDAEWCSIKVNELEKQWSCFVPKNARDKHFPLLRKVTKAARRFVVKFGSAGGRLGVSNPDILLICFSILKELQEKPTPEEAKLASTYGKLKKARKDASILLRYIQGFVKSLECFAGLGGDHQGTTYFHFLKLWEKHEIAHRAHPITTYAWKNIEAAVESADLTLRQANFSKASINERGIGSGLSLDPTWLSTHDIDRVAEDAEQTSVEEKLSLPSFTISCLQEYKRVVKKKHTDLTSAAWTGKLQKISVEGWSTNIFSSATVFVKIKITGPPQVFETERTWREHTMKWLNIDKDISLHADSEIQVEVFHDRSEGHERRWHTKFCVSDGGVVEDSQQSQFAMCSGGVYTLLDQDTTVCHRVYITINMDDHSARIAKAKRLKSFNWTQLLPEDMITQAPKLQTEEGDASSCECTDCKAKAKAAALESRVSLGRTGSLPAALEAGKTRNGSVFYVDRETAQFYNSTEASLLLRTVSN